MFEECEKCGCMKLNIKWGLCQDCQAQEDSDDMELESIFSNILLSTDISLGERASEIFNDLKREGF